MTVHFLIAPMKCLVAMCLCLTSFLALGQFNSNKLVTSELDFERSYNAYTDLAVTWKMEGKIQANLNEGINNIQEGKAAQAANDLTAAIQLDSTLFEAYYYRAIAYRLTREFEDAEEDLSRLRSLKREPYLIAMESGKVAEGLNNLRKAKQYYDQCLKLKPGDDTPTNLIGNMYWKADNVAEAKIYFKKLVDANTKIPEAYLKLGLIEASERKDVNAGHVLFEKAWDVDSTNRSTIVVMAITKLRSGNLVAIPYWDKLVALDPTNTLYRFYRGSLYANVGNFDVAFSEFRTAINNLPHDPNKFAGAQSLMDKILDIQYALYYTTSTMYGVDENDQAIVKKAYCLIATGEGNAALNELKRAKESSITAFLRALALEHRGMHNDAFDAYDKALELDNDIFDAHKKRGIYHMELENWKLAENDFNDMIRIDPQTAIGYEYKGICNYKQRKFVQAIDNFTKALSYDSTNEDVLEYRGLCHKAVNNYLDASSDFIKARVSYRVELEMFKAEMAKYTIKDTTATIDQLTTFTRRFPKFFPAHYHKIRLMAARNQWPQITSCIDRALRADISKEDRSLHSWVFTVKGQLMKKGLQPEKAKSFFERAIDKDDNNSLAHLEIGKVLVDMNQNKAAISHLKKAAQLGETEASEILGRLGAK